MAKKTRAQIAEENRIAKELAEAEERAAYPRFMMETLEAAAAAGDFRISVLDGAFYVYEENGTYSSRAYRITAEYCPEGWEALEELVYVVTMIKAAKEEEQRKYDLRKNALNKLTQEERQVLGL